MNTEEVRSLLIAHAGIKKWSRVYEDGRRVQTTDSLFLSRPRVEHTRTFANSVISYPVPVAYAHVPRREYGPRDEPLIDKFMRKVDKDPDGHWRWAGHLTRQGYGRFSLKVDGKNKTVAAHRWIYEQLVRPLEPGEVIDHVHEVCGIRSCVNVAHLEAVSHEENARRGRVKLSLALRDRCNNGHVLDEVGTHTDERGTVLCNQCCFDKNVRSHASFYSRRAIICAELGLPHIVCKDGHRLDLENALLKSGLCRECHRLAAQRSRDRKRAAAS